MKNQHNYTMYARLISWIVKWVGFVTITLTGSKKAQKIKRYQLRIQHVFLVVYCKFLFVLLVAGFLLKFSVSAVAVLATSAQYF